MLPSAVAGSYYCSGSFGIYLQINIIRSCCEKTKFYIWRKWTGKPLNVHGKKIVVKVLKETVRIWQKRTARAILRT